MAEARDSIPERLRRKIAEGKPIIGAARGVRQDVIVLCHGGPIAMPEDAAYVLKNCKAIHGFCGASSMERLPTERAIKEQVERFTQITMA